MKKCSVVFVCVFLWEAVCMKTVSINVQGVDNRNLMACITNDNPAVYLRNLENREVNNINLGNGTFLIVFKRQIFPSQSIAIRANSNDLFAIMLEKDRTNGSPNVKLARISDDIKYALYRSRAGGGDSYVLAVGDNAGEVSVSAVQAHQLHGKMQAYIPVF